MATNPTLPVVAPGELITATHMNNVRANIDRLDTTKLSLTGGTMTGTLIGTRFRVLSDTSAVVDFFRADGTTRVGYVRATPDQTEIHSETGDVITMAGNAEQHRTQPGRTLFGKTVTNFAGVAGVEIESTSTNKGGVRSTIQASTVNYYANHIGSADTNGANYAQFTRGATIIGNIVQVSTTGVAYNTTSDKRLKRVTRYVDGDEAVDRVARMEPVNFTWAAAPADGEQVGFLAQDLYAVAPEAVTVGHGEPGDAPDADGQGGFVPWMVDPARLVPTLVAAVQALTRRIEQLEGQTP